MSGESDPVQTVTDNSKKNIICYSKQLYTMSIIISFIPFSMILTLSDRNGAWRIFRQKMSRSIDSKNCFFPLLFGRQYGILIDSCNTLAALRTIGGCRYTGVFSDLRTEEKKQ